MEKQSILQKPSVRRRAEFLAAASRSKRLHGRWTKPPGTEAEFDAYLKHVRRKAHEGYWVVTEENELAGVINVSEIVRGAFCSGYLGYYAFAPHTGRGYMTRGLAAVLSEAFGPLRLHRLEANIQPENEDSRSLVQRLGFRGQLGSRALNTLIRSPLISALKMECPSVGTMHFQLRFYALAS